MADIFTGLKNVEKVSGIFHRAVGEIFSVAEQQSYGFLDSIEARRRIDNAAWKYDREIKMIVLSLEKEIDRYKAESNSV